ncbi:MAG: hypothetical protein ACFB0C_22150 [Leptolyngbyaceae cyanobacterium]
MPSNLKLRFVYGQGRVTVRGLGVLRPEKQLSNLAEWFVYVQAVVKESAMAL